MDGRNVQKVVDRVFRPVGIAVDQNSSKVFWTDHGEHTITGWTEFPQHGKHVRLAKAWTGGNPSGVVVHNDHLFWGTFRDFKLRTATINGYAVKVVYRGISEISQVDVIRDRSQVLSRPNHCSGQTCSGICLLNPTSFSCVN